MPLRRAWQPYPVFLPWRVPWTEEPGGIQSIGFHSQTKRKWISMPAKCTAQDSNLVDMFYKLISMFILLITWAHSNKFSVWLYWHLSNILWERGINKFKMQLSVLQGLAMRELIKHTISTSFWWLHTIIFNWDIITLISSSDIYKLQRNKLLL